MLPDSVFGLKSYLKLVVAKATGFAEAAYDLAAKAFFGATLGSELGGFMTLEPVLPKLPMRGSA